MTSPAPSRHVRFVGGDAGAWRVVAMTTILGEAMPAVARVAIVSTSSPSTPEDVWSLRGVISNERYVARVEKEALIARQEGLGRPQATRAALIPIRKSPAWWALPQDERRAIMEEHSHHIAIGLRYLPAIARRLHHCRDLESAEPFDFLTWFEYAPHDETAFETLLSELRASAEWAYVEREVDIRLVADA